MLIVLEAPSPRSMQWIWRYGPWEDRYMRNVGATSQSY